MNAEVSFARHFFFSFSYVRLKEYEQVLALLLSHCTT